MSEDVETSHKKYQLAEWLKGELMNNRPVDWMAFQAKGSSLGLNESDIEAVKQEFSEVMAHRLFGYVPNVDLHELSELAHQTYQELQRFYGHTLSSLMPDELSRLIARRIKSYVQARTNKMALPIGGGF